MNALDFITSRPWAIEQSALENILTIIERRGELEALATRAGEPLKNTRTIERRADTAIVPITGPIFRYANLFTEISGATSTQVLATDIQAALDDPAVKRLVLNIDSPGGRAEGINELGQLIYAARGVKPVVAYVGGAAQSAAYWLASAAQSITVDPTAVLGSIGVVATVLDTRKREEKDGVRRYEFVSSSSPNKRPDLESEAGREQMQVLVDELADVFIAAVARNRGVSAETVAKDFGAGGSFVGASAVRAGLADGLGSLEDVIAGRPPHFVAPKAARAPAVRGAGAAVAESTWDAMARSVYEVRGQGEERK